jgi:threonyl-tRNA synthetase
VMVHRALLGSFERFIGILIEHYAGEFPLWLAPVQAVVLPIADRHAPYAESVATRLRAAGLRVEVDRRSESVNRRIRDTELRKVPYMLVVGDREEEAGQAALRAHRRGDEGSAPVQEIVERLAGQAADRLA